MSVLRVHDAGRECSEQLKTRRGGADDARLLCVVITSRKSKQGRSYRLLPATCSISRRRQLEGRARQEQSVQPNNSVSPGREISLNEIRRISAPLMG